MAYEWALEEYERLPPAIQEIRRLLQDWFQAMESGAVYQRMPDPLYPVRIDMQVVDRIVDWIDREFDKEVWAWAGLEAAGGYGAGPGFSRLKPAQRLALAQQLHTLKQKYKPKLDEPVPVEQERPGGPLYSRGDSPARIPRIR